MSPSTKSKSLWSPRTPPTSIRRSIPFSLLFPRTPSTASTELKNGGSFFLGSAAAVQDCAAAAAAGFVARAWSRRDFHGAGPRQRRADFLALHDRQIRPHVSLPPLARLPAAGSD